jgi:hypothetical protein
MVSHPQRIGHDGQGRIHRTAGREEAGVDDIEVVNVVRLTVDIERRGLGIDPKADGAVLMGDPGQGDTLADE